METDKGVIGANLRAAQPTTDPWDLAWSEMMRLICREADKSFFHFRENYIGHLKEDETVDYYRQPPSDTLHALDSTPDGLTPEQAAARLARDGHNALTEPPKPSLVKRFFQQLADPMILVLLAAALISAITSAYAHESFADVIIILIVVIINAVLGVYQESKAEQAIAALKELSAAHSRVLRGGKLVTVPSEELVAGDVLVLEAGDAVPADARVLESASLRAEEAALTGESVPVTKSPDALTAAGDIGLGDRSNMLYLGSSIVYGRGRAVVTETGMQTQMGHIADALTQTKENKTPLQLRLSQLSRILTWLVLGICVVVFAVGVLRAGTINGRVVLDTFLIAVSLAVAAIPEGLAAVVTIVLSIGVTNMSRRSAVIRRLTAVETLGCAQVICSDKTGTLTQNRMTVTECAGSDEHLLATAMALCVDAVHDPETDIVTGEPTEAALVRWAVAQGLSPSVLRAQYPRVAEAPFDSERKMMSTLHTDGSSVVQYTKGAPDVLLPLCDRIWIDGRAEPMTDAHRAEIAARNRDMTGRALRVLAAGMRTYDALPGDTSPAALEQHLCFLGLAGMIDPVRPEVVDAIRACRSAGIRPIMITGDHVDTATAIAKELGLLAPGDEAVTGTELSAMDDDTFRRRLQHISVYARVQPEHKTRIVKAWRDAGFVTAMTGDGVNDAPSIRAADIGIGMGITGTDVTKNVADMVLADDNFATIVGAVEEGRRIYDNIQRAIKFLLGSNMSEVLSIFTATMLGFMILEPVHLLWINLLTDCFPALALGMERAEPDVMSRPPRSARESIFAHGVGFDCVYQGVMCAILTLAAFFIGHYMEYGVWTLTNSPDGTTMAFLTLSMAEIFHSFNMRAHRASIFTLRTPNWTLVGAAAASLALTTLCIYVPFLADAFDFTAISAAEYAVAMGLAVSVIPIVELVKCVQRAVEKRAAHA